MTTAYSCIKIIRTSVEGNESCPAREPRRIDYDILFYLIYGCRTVEDILSASGVKKDIIKRKVESELQFLETAGCVNKVDEGYKITKVGIEYF